MISATGELWVFCGFGVSSFGFTSGFGLLRSRGVVSGLRRRLNCGSSVGLGFLLLGLLEALGLGDWAPAIAWCGFCAWV